MFSSRILEITPSATEVGSRASCPNSAGAKSAVRSRSTSACVTLGTLLLVNFSRASRRVSTTLASWPCTAVVMCCTALDADVRNPRDVSKASSGKCPGSGMSGRGGRADPGQSCVKAALASRSCIRTWAMCCSSSLTLASTWAMAATPAAMNRSAYVVAAATDRNIVSRLRIPWPAIEPHGRSACSAAGGRRDSQSLLTGSAAPLSRTVESGVVSLTML